MLKILESFSLVWVLMYRYSKSAFLQVTFILELEWTNISIVDILTQIFLHSFDFHCLTNFVESINLSWMVSLWRQLLCKWSIYKLKSVRGDFKTQPPADRRFCSFPPGFYCSKQWQPSWTGRNRRSTGGWVLKPPLTNKQIIPLSLMGKLMFHLLLAKYIKWY